MSAITSKTAFVAKAGLNQKSTPTLRTQFTKNARVAFKTSNGGKAYCMQVNDL